MVRISAETRLVLTSNLLHVHRRTHTTKLVCCFEDSLFEKKTSKTGVHTFFKHKAVT